MKRFLILSGLLCCCAAVAGCDSAKSEKMHFILSAEQGDVDTVKQLVTKFPELARATNDSGVPVLVLMLGRGAPDTVELLLKNGADPDSPGDGRNLPLSVAMQNGTHLDELKLLLDAGANPNVASHGLGLTPLMSAANYGSEPAVQALVEKNADVNAVDDAGKLSVLHHAVYGANAAVVTYLLQHGARADVKNTDGMTPLQLAMSASTPQLTPEQVRAKVALMATTNPGAALAFGSRAIVRNVAAGTLAGKDLSGVIAALKAAGAH